MRAVVVSTVIASVALGGGVARADQCLWVKDRVAKEAQRLLQGRNAIEFCEPCNAKAPSAPVLATSVEVQQVPENLRYSKVVMNGREIDLAYVFVQSAPDRYQNLGLLAECGASDVSASLQIADVTPNGVMITASGPVQAPVAPVAAPAPSSPPMVYVNQPSTPAPIQAPSAMSSLALMIFSGFTGLALGAIAVLIMVGWRRRVALQPRAGELRADS